MVYFVYLLLLFLFGDLHINLSIKLCLPLDLCVCICEVGGDGMMVKLSGLLVEGSYWSILFSILNLRSCSKLIFYTLFTGYSCIISSMICTFFTIYALSTLLKSSGLLFFLLLLYEPTSLSKIQNLSYCKACFKSTYCCFFTSFPMNLVNLRWAFSIFKLDFSLGSICACFDSWSSWILVGE